MPQQSQAPSTGGTGGCQRPSEDIAVKPYELAVFHVFRVGGLNNEVLELL
jgi:hypothetical protein